MTPSVTDARIEALAEDAAKAAFRDLGSNTTAAEVRAYCLGYLAALRSQGKVVEVSILVTLVSKWEAYSSRVRNNDYEAGIERGMDKCANDLTAIIGEGD